MKFVLGVDEAGRGPLAGPVAVGVVSVREDVDLLKAFPGLNDSKKLRESARDALYDLLVAHAQSGNVSYHVELVSHKVIDDRGISHAIARGVRKGIQKLMPEPQDGKVWLDGSLKAPEAYEQETVIKGDSLIPAIMLASIAAKVTRDRYMTRFGRRFPAYGFERHKGYGTDLHYKALKEFGLCDLHRRTFIHLDELDHGC